MQTCDLYGFEHQRAKQQEQNSKSKTAHGTSNRLGCAIGQIYETADTSFKAQATIFKRASSRTLASPHDLYKPPRGWTKQMGSCSPFLNRPAGLWSQIYSDHCSRSDDTITILIPIQRSSTPLTASREATEVRLKQKTVYSLRPKIHSARD